MRNILITLFALIIAFSFEKDSLASDLYFIDYSKVMNESKAGKKAQDQLRSQLKNSNKKFNETAKKLKEEENKIIGQKNVLSKEEYKKKADELRKKVFNLNKEREKTIKDIAMKRKSRRSDA